MKQFLTIMLIATGIICLAADNRVVGTETVWVGGELAQKTGYTVRQTRYYANGTKITRTLPVVEMKLPERVLNPANYGRTDRGLEYVNTQDLIMQGRQILKEGGNLLSDDLVNGDTYYRIPTATDAFGKRW